MPTLQLINSRAAITPPPGSANPAEDYDVYFMITGKQADGRPINLNPEVQIGVSYKLHDYIKGSTGGKITFDYLDSGRLYIGYGELPYKSTVAPPYKNPAGHTDQPVPYWKRYYGVVEFAYVPGDTGLWIDLTDVNLVALPISLSGFTQYGQKFKLGYKITAEELRKRIIPQIGLTDSCSDPYKPTDGVASIIDCVSGFKKVVSPTAGNTGCWASFDQYIHDLKNDETQIAILSDVTQAAYHVPFTGSFQNVTDGDDYLITLHGAAKPTTFGAPDPGITYDLQIQLGQFTTSHIYACANGFIHFAKTENGKTTKATIPFNAPGASGFSSDDLIVSNSTVRNLLIGMNEGRFYPSPSTKVDPRNDNTNWGTKGYEAFQQINLNDPAKNRGNQYAYLVYENANAYGYPYADKYLSALAVANVNHPVVITACSETAPCGYSKHPPMSRSPYTFNIGVGSGSLGEISIQGAGAPFKSSGFEPAKDGAYSGGIIAPDGWSKMYFAGAGDDKYIYYKDPETGGNALHNVDSDGKPCLLGSGGKPATAIWFDKNLRFGGPLKWNDGAGPASDPT
ncbi:MAG: hypothetical protein AAF587_00010 [Bacteroidota bacterium]